jgi:hypothetical protein
MKGKWIWYPGDFEIYHNLLLSCRREERGAVWPTYWRLDDCYHNVLFRKTVTLQSEESVRFVSNGIGYVSLNNMKVPINKEMTLHPGTYDIVVAAAKTDGLPCVFISGSTVQSDESWEVSCLNGKWLPAGCNGMYCLPSQNPEVFPFCYKDILPVHNKKVKGGVLYDFGRETFAEIRFRIECSDLPLSVFYGESEEEALDTDYSYIRDQVPPMISEYSMKARAFRYLFIPDSARKYELSAKLQYLPLEQKGTFSCSDERINEIWRVAAYTFHLNSREFFLDGIKRDRWVWSGDSVQDFLINYYLFFDPEINKRTIIALRGKDPVEQYINTIMDYSFLWIIGIYDYYRYTGDRKFIQFIYPKMKTMMDYCLERINSDGFIEAREGDWVFIDWADFDKTGVLCVEQMLLARCLEIMSECAGLLQKDGSSYFSMGKDLKEKIDRYFWNEKLGAYVDSYVSGKNHVTRHANILSIIFQFADEGKKQKIVKNVLLNTKIPKITTPYFQFYELDVMCRLGMFDNVTSRVRDYWGGMLDLGATTFWEEFDPTQKGTGHYAMYGDKYGKSLCHAWGASPIYLLGRYYLGVHPTSPGYRTFLVEPNLGGLDRIEGTVPMNEGNVKIYLDHKVLRVTATKDGGIVVYQSKSYKLSKNQELFINLRYT